MKFPAILLAAALAAAPLCALPSQPAELLQIEARFEGTAKSGSGTIQVAIQIASGWHVNSHRPSEDYLIATTVKLDPAAGVTAGEPRYPEGKPVKFAFAEKPLSVYEDRFLVEVPITFRRLPASLSGSVDFQACNDKQCLAPASVRFETKGIQEIAASSSPASSPMAGGAVPLSQAPANPATDSRGSRDFGALLERRGLFIALLFTFGWGLALNLTPCVYPVIPLTVSFFGGQASGNGRRTLGLAALYVLGMATMYSALGVAAAL